MMHPSEGPCRDKTRHRRDRPRTINIVCGKRHDRRAHSTFSDKHLGEPFPHGRSPLTQPIAPDSPCTDALTFASPTVLPRAPRPAPIAGDTCQPAKRRHSESCVRSPRPTPWSAASGGLPEAGSRTEGNGSRPQGGGREGTKAGRGLPPEGGEPGQGEGGKRKGHGGGGRELGGMGVRGSWM